jgi:hypothetical protein
MDVEMSAAVQDAIANPSKIFNAPMDVIEAPGMTNGEKRAILESWEQEARLLQTATGENMSGGEPSRIEDVRKALDALANREA